MSRTAASTRRVAVTFVFELPVDLGLAVDGLVLPGHEYGFTARRRLRIYLRRRLYEEPPVSEAMRGLESYFTGLAFETADDVAFLPRPRGATVAAVTVAHHTQAERFAPTAAWLTRRFDEAFAGLNQFLDGLGFASRVADVGALRRTELPPWIPAIVDDSVSETSTRRRALLTALQLHDFDDLRVPHVDPDAVSTAAWLFDRATSDQGTPFQLFIAYVQRARRDLDDGLTREAVLALGTAVETLVAVALRSVWQAEGENEASIKRKLHAGFRNLLEHHLRLRIDAAGADPSAIDAWDSECYQLRNQVAHEGLLPDPRAAMAAWRATMSLAVEVAETLRNDNRLTELADTLLLQRPPTGDPLTATDDRPTPPVS
jgi:hypothetical protein